MVFDLTQAEYYKKNSRASEAEEADYHSQAGAGGYSSMTIIREFQDWDGIVHGGKLRNSGRLDWEAGFKSVIRDN